MAEEGPAVDPADLLLKAITACGKTAWSGQTEEEAKAAANEFIKAHPGVGGGGDVGAVLEELRKVNQELLKVNQKLDKLQADTAEKLDKLHNVGVRAYNRAAALRPLLNAAGAEPPGEANFPTSNYKATQVTGPDLDKLGAFYGRQFTGDNIEARRSAFSIFIGRGE